MTVQPMNNTRAARLARVFVDFLRGSRKVSNVADARLFLEAATQQPSPTACLEAIVSNGAGLDAVRHSVRADSGIQFISLQVLPFVYYFASHPAPKTIFGGHFLQQLVVVILDPPTLWKVVADAYVSGKLQNTPEAEETFGWLSLEIASHRGPELSGALDELVKALEQRPLLASSDHKVREFGYRVQKALALANSSTPAVTGDTPGGRHDNDFADYRCISIYPTSDELKSTARPFYLSAGEVASTEQGSRAGVHLDNQYRLYREDMLAELREDIQVVTGRKKGRRAPQVFGGLAPVGIETGNERYSRSCCVLVSVSTGLEVLRKHKDEIARKKFLKDNPSILRHQAFGVLCDRQDIIAFAFVYRDEDLLSSQPPVLCLQFAGSEAFSKAIESLVSKQDLRFILVDTPVFAYEPVLKRLKEITEMPLEEELLGPDEEGGGFSAAFEPTSHVQDEIDRLKTDGGRLRMKASGIILDKSQCEAIIRALSERVSVIQGPPGTGKSFVGALTAKLLLGEVKNNTRILVLSYTNHALDQFLHDLMDVGIDHSRMVRLGSKSSEETSKISFEPLFRTSNRKWAQSTNSLVRQLKMQMSDLRSKIDDVFCQVTKRPFSLNEVLEHLEFAQLEYPFLDAFSVPDEEEGFARVGKDNKTIDNTYLINRWVQGLNYGGVQPTSPAGEAVWLMPPVERRTHFQSWAEAVHREKLERLQVFVEQFDEAQRSVDRIFNEAKCNFIQTKQVIGCTTTAAAKYSALIKAAKPDVVLVEEAGEILEAHVLAALNMDTKQLILIGDHKQLRPKINNYALSVEKGDGYDLNRSLFERLILQGHPHTTLQKQHRMHPDISGLVRAMTYPELLDDEKTASRKALRGICGRVAFINHDKAEDKTDELRDRRDAGAKASKQNRYEAQMVLKLVKYLGQQGYKTDNIVVLTPYLGQLRLLRDMLTKENDPWLNDLDSFELIRAGLLTQAAGKLNKSRIRLSTIDNYQGEESDIVIASLTRSNSKGDIGFMKAPERLNVLLSRARCGLIMIGNMETFMASAQGKALWTSFFQLLKERKFLQDGFRVRCEQHPEHEQLLTNPDDFDRKCPDGGCAEKCDVKMSCGLHACPRRCHRLVDHSQMPCNKIFDRTCEKKGHKYKVKCSNQPRICTQCQREEEDFRRRLKSRLEAERETFKKQEDYRRRIQIIDDKIYEQERLLQEKQEEDDQEKNLLKSQDRLKSLTETNKRREAIDKAEKAAEETANKKRESAQKSAKSQQNSDPDAPPDSAKARWQSLKRTELASNEALDVLVDMIGLEDVKMEFLNMKDQTDTAIRQGISMKTNRYGCSMLGNPGTGKTTVARLYAKFLTSMGVISGNTFEETSGAKLANIGVTGCQKLLDDVLAKGGGVVFIDEAYQLASGNSPGGRAVLDFLLAEVENHTGTIIFVLAGYTKQMETFYAHNPGLPSRFPIEMKFADYTDDELLRILEYKTNAKYSNSMKVEDGPRGLYCRIVSRRLGRGRGKEGFGNARAVENMLARICKRQAQRLSKERRTGNTPDDLLMTKEDLIGPEPTNALTKSAAWNTLQSMIGLQSVKDSIRALVDSIQANHERELNEEPLIEFSLNRLFLGNPGTGKTTVAKHYGQILVDLGMLTNGEVIVKNPADFTGAVLGESEKLTKGILASTAGKVLVIDEAYGLYEGGGEGGSGKNPYKTAVIDTIVAEVQFSPGDDRCVLLLGYTDQMEDMLENANPGLSRRFPRASAFVFADFNAKEMTAILNLKLKLQGYTVTDQAKQVALDVLERARNKANFGNAGEIDILLNDAKIRHQKRLSSGKTQRRTTFDAYDIDEEYGRLEKAETNVAMLFKGTVGCDKIIATLQGYQQDVQLMKQLNMDPKENIPFNFLFRGPPGTGKTSTARKMGKVFYDAGFLASAEVIEASASDLVAQFVGQTGPKTRRLLDRALGRVLLIDEAYRLAEGQFAQEALDELVDAVTKERYQKRLIIILAGYERDINRLLDANQGLTSRFPEVIDFYPLDPGSCFELLTTSLLREKEQLERKSASHNLEASCMERPTVTFKNTAVELFGQLTAQPNWANARDVLTLAKAIYKNAIKVLVKQRQATLTEGMVLDELRKMVQERDSRAKLGRTVAKETMPMSTATMKPEPPRLGTSTSTSTASNTPRSQDDTSEDELVSPAPNKVTLAAHVPGPLSGGRRDAGVSDETWAQLQKDAQAASDCEQQYQMLLKKKRAAADDATRERIVKELVAEEERRQREAEVRKKLETQGHCPAGFSWIKQSTGWRCAGGSHWVGNSEL